MGVKKLDFCKSNGYILLQIQLIVFSLSKLLKTCMPLYKSFKKSLPPAAEKLLQAAFRSILARPGISASRGAPLMPVSCGVPGTAVGNVLAKHDYFEHTRLLAEKTNGAKIVSGWCLEELRRKGLDKFVVILSHHAVIEMPGGQLLCPNTPVGEEIRFLRDDSRPHDLTGKAPLWNRVVYTNVVVKGSLGTAFPFTLNWATTWGDDQAYSSNPLHAQWLSWAQSDPVERLIGMGCSPNAAVNVVMMSDLDELCNALQVKPSAAQLTRENLMVLIGEIRKLKAQGVFKPHDDPFNSSNDSKTTNEGVPPQDAANEAVSGRKR